MDVVILVNIYREYDSIFIILDDKAGRTSARKRYACAQTYS